MASEEILKEHESLRSNSKMLKEKKQKTTKPLNGDKISINVDFLNERANSLIHIRQLSFLSESIISYLAIGICLFIYGCHGLKWFDINDDNYKQFYLGYFLISGLVLYVIGIMNWYEGKEHVFLIDFSLSFLFITLFLKNQNNIFGDISNYSNNNNDKLQGIFYILFFCLILVIGISSKEKGFVLIIDYATLFISYIFLFAYKFFRNNIIETIDYYMFIVSGAFFWITGIFLIIQNIYGILNF